MKSITCKDLGGACEIIFVGSSFEEVEQQSKNHGKEMFQQKDQPHLEAMKSMTHIYNNQEKFEAWYQSKKEFFDNLPE